jgi:hypothetical protein
MKRRPGPRTPSGLSQSIHQRLNSYALLASAAGVGVLASAQPATAKIVYTPAHIPIMQNTGPVELDLNNDGVNDFQFSNSYYSEAKRRPPEGFVQFGLRVSPAQQSNRVRGIESNRRFCAAHLPQGRKVGPDNPFQPGHSSLMMLGGVGDATSFNSFCPWLRVQQGYLGLKFVIAGKVHFGWARIKLRGTGITAPTITGYAYETVPNKPIITGNTKEDSRVEEPIASSMPARQPRTLATLALGFAAASVWRRNDLVSSPS